MLPTPFSTSESASSPQATATIRHSHLQRIIAQIGAVANRPVTQPHSYPSTPIISFSPLVLLLSLLLNHITTVARILSLSVAHREHFRCNGKIVYDKKYSYTQILIQMKIEHPKGLYGRRGASFL